jgi:hypothetical protein
LRTFNLQPESSHRPCPSVFVRACPCGCSFRLQVPGCRFQVKQQNACVVCASFAPLALKGCSAVRFPLTSDLCILTFPQGSRFQEKPSPTLAVRARPCLSVSVRVAVPSPPFPPHPPALRRCA